MSSKRRGTRKLGGHTGSSTPSHGTNGNGGADVRLNDLPMVLPSEFDDEEVMTKMRFTEKGVASSGWEDPESSQFPWPSLVRDRMVGMKRPAELLAEYQAEFVVRLEQFIQDWEQEYGEQLESLEEGQYGPPVDIPDALVEDSMMWQPAIHAAVNAPNIVSPWTTGYAYDAQLINTLASSSSSSSSSSSAASHSLSSLSHRGNQSSRASNNSSKRKTPLDERPSSSLQTGSGTPSKRTSKSSKQENANQSALFTQLGTAGSPSHNYIVRVLQQRFALAKTRTASATPEFLRTNAKRGLLCIHPDFMIPESIANPQQESSNSTNNDNDDSTVDGQQGNENAEKSSNVSGQSESENSTVKNNESGSVGQSSSNRSNVTVTVPSPPKSSQNGFMQSPRSTVITKDNTNVQSQADNDNNAEEKKQLVECPNILQLLMTTMDVLLSSGTSISQGNYLWENIYPQDKDTRVPVFNPQGKYLVKLFLHGSWRSVMVDDRIPVDSQGIPLVVFSSDISEIWPMLISKALLKLCNGFPALQEPECLLHWLTGWIPQVDRISFSSSWDKLQNLLTDDDKSASASKHTIDPESLQEYINAVKDAREQINMGAGDSNTVSRSSNPNSRANSRMSARSGGRKSRAKSRASGRDSTVNIIAEPAKHVAGVPMEAIKVVIPDVYIPLVERFLDYQLPQNHQQQNRTSNLVGASLKQGIPYAMLERGGLVPGLMYTVCELKEVRGTRLIRLDCPHSNWLGKFGDQDTITWSPVFQNDMGVDRQCRLHHLEASQPLTDFWMAFKDFCYFFGNLHIFHNHHAAVFPVRIEMQDLWQDQSVQYACQPSQLLHVNAPEPIQLMFTLTPAIERISGQNRECRLELEEYSWDDLAACKVVARVSAFRCHTTVLTIPQGDHTYRLRATSVRGFSLVVSSMYREQIAISNTQPILDTESENGSSENGSSSSTSSSSSSSSTSSTASTPSTSSLLSPGVAMLKESKSEVVQSEKLETPSKSLLETSKSESVGKSKKEGKQRGSKTKRGTPRSPKKKRKDKDKDKDKHQDQKDGKSGDDSESMLGVDKESKKLQKSRSGGSSKTTESTATSGIPSANRLATWLQIGSESEILDGIMGVQCLDAEGEVVGNTLPNQWTVWFKHVVTVKEIGVLTARLRFKNRANLASIRLQIIDNDKPAKIIGSLPIDGCGVQTVPTVYRPNKSGYTIVADSCPTEAMDADMYSLRLFSSHKQVEWEPMALGQVQEIEGRYVPNKYLNVCRFWIVSKDRVDIAAQLTAIDDIGKQSDQPMGLKLGLSKNGKLALVKGEGASTASILVGKVEAPAKPEGKSNGSSANSNLAGKGYLVHAELDTLDTTFATPFKDDVMNGLGTPTSVRGAVSGSPRKVSKVGVKSGKSKKNAEAQSNADLDPRQFRWVLRVVASGPIEIKMDTQKQDEFQATISEWEKSESGRSKKAAGSRDRFLALKSNDGTASTTSPRGKTNALATTSSTATSSSSGSMTSRSSKKKRDKSSVGIGRVDENNVPYLEKFEAREPLVRVGIHEKIVQMDDLRDKKRQLEEEKAQFAEQRQIKQAARQLAREQRQERRAALQKQSQHWRMQVKNAQNMDKDKLTFINALEEQKKRLEEERLLKLEEDKQAALEEEKRKASAAANASTEGTTDRVDRSLSVSGHEESSNSGSGNTTSRKSKKGGATGRRTSRRRSPRNKKSSRKE